MTANRRRLVVGVTVLAVMAFSCSGDTSPASAPPPDVSPAAEPPPPAPLPPPDPAPEPPLAPEPSPLPEPMPPEPPPEPGPEPVGRPPADLPETATPPDFVPADLAWEPATILTFEGAADEIVPVYDSPDGERVTFWDGDRPSAAWFGVPLPLVVRVVQGSEGDGWVEVELPVRPNGSRGWIRTDGFAWSTVDHHILVDLSERRLAFFHGDELTVHTRVIVGMPPTTTPTALGFIIGKLPNHDQQFAGVVYGDWILPVSFFSEALNSFGGFLPRVSLNGTHIPERVGEAITSLEVRIPNEIIEIIAREAPIGTTVRIVE